VSLRWPRTFLWVQGCAIGVPALFAALGCSTTEGPLLERLSLNDAGGDAAAPNSAPTVKPGTSLQYQLTGTLDTSVEAQLYVVDLFDTSAQRVSELHAQGRLVMSYVSVGSFEPWRDDASSFPRAAIGMTLANYPNESWLDVRDSSVRRALAARFDRARSKGFDGVFMSTLGAYMQATGFGLTRQDQLDFDGFLANAAHARGLSAGLSGDFELGSELADSFDWALAIGCVARMDCGALAPFKTRDKAVFDLETEGQHDAVCAAAAQQAIVTVMKHSGFDAWRSPCP
jgi:hypothetical protein